MGDDKERVEGSLTDGGSLPGRKQDPRSFGGERAADEADASAEAEKGGRLPGEADLSTQRGKDLPDGGYAAPGEEPPERPQPPQPGGARGYGG